MDLHRYCTQPFIDSSLNLFELLIVLGDDKITSVILEACVVSEHLKIHVVTEKIKKILDD